jgi:hypothetical protein
MVLEKTQTYIFSSDPANGAENTTQRGDEFSTTLYNPIHVPQYAKYCTLSVIGANIWWTVPNVSAAKNNNVFEYFDGTATRSITIPDGLYDLPSLEQAIYIQIDNIAGALPSDQTFNFVGDSATQKVVITFLSAGLVIDWTASTVRDILGYTTGSTPSVGQDESIIGENVAAFNTITSFLIKSNIIHDGIPVNARSSNVISNVFIDVPPGSLINYQPQNVSPVNADELIGASISNIRFNLTDQTNQPVDTNGEYWSFTMVIKYYISEDHI